MIGYNQLVMYIVEQMSSFKILLQLWRTVVVNPGGRKNLYTYATNRNTMNPGT